MPTSFPPVVDVNSRVLVLGSMPGEASLRAGQYYAHPRNALWRIIAEVVGFDPDVEYAQRIEAVRDAGIGLWDVLHRCERIGSMDSAIARDSMEMNDFRRLFGRYPLITRVFFNGAKAEQLFVRHMRPALDDLAIEYRRLPSTSPANASIPFAAKVAAWRAVVEVR